MPTEANVAKRLLWVASGGVLGWFLTVTAFDERLAVTRPNPFLEHWTGIVYPDRNYLLDHRELISVYMTLGACREAATRYIEAAGYVNADYECGLNCYRRIGSTLNICERTVGGPTAAAP